MRLLGINLQNFRNLRSSSLTFSTDRVFFLGSNGQGKSNLLEAIGVCSTLRSFRGASSESMVRADEKEAQLYARFLDDYGTEREAMITFGTRGTKVVQIDGEPAKRLGDFLGQFPSVCLSSRDFRLVRESPSDRRKWMDLVLSSSSPEYLRALQVYYRSMKERNTLLKKEARDAEVAAFEYTLSSSAHILRKLRSSFFPSINEVFEQSYTCLSNSLEKAGLSYLPDAHGESVSEWVEFFTQERHKDRLFGSTRKGPHRDDFSLLLNNRDARHYGSEGQQKGLVLALRLAEFSFLQQQLGIIPILLADDVLGELDASRRANFRKLLSPQAQTFSTGTSYPSENEKEMWETFEVNEGRFNPLISPVHND